MCCRKARRTEPDFYRSRVKVKVEYIGPTTYMDRVMIRVTFRPSGSSGIMYIMPDALPHKYGME